MIKAIKKRLYDQALSLVIREHHNWEKDHTQGIRLDLSIARLANVDCRKSFLLSWDFTESVFSDPKFHGAKFIKPDFKWCGMNQADFREAILHSSNFDKADFSFSSLVGTILRKVRLPLHVDNRQAQELDNLSVGLKSTYRTFANILVFLKKDSLMQSILMPSIQDQIASEMSYLKEKGIQDG